MSAHVLLNLSNKLRKNDKMQGDARPTELSRQLIYYEIISELQ